MTKYVVISYNVANSMHNALQISQLILINILA